MPRAGLNPAAVVDAALAIVDEHSGDALTLAGLAGQVGVATPSLYKHIRSLSDLRTLIGVRVLDELADRVAEAAVGRSGDDAVRAVMHAYRDYARAYPRRYAALPQQPGTDPETVRAGDRAVGTFLAVLRGYGLAGSGAIHATRGLRAAAHGFVSLEIAGAFGLPEKLDDSYDELVTALIAGLRARATG